MADNEQQNRYAAIIEHIFLQNYKKGDTEVPFVRDDIEKAASTLKIAIPKNLGDLVYSFRYRSVLPQSIKSKAPKGKSWLIRPAGRAKYVFVASAVTAILPNRNLTETKVPDSTPGIIDMYSLSDEQALLAKLRYNRLLDVFTGITCYSLQSHLRTAVKRLGQVETDEIYVGLDRRGAHYVIPVQAKGGSDRLSIVQIEQDVALCEAKFPDLICRPVAAQFMEGSLIAMFAFESEIGVGVSLEKHYRLVPPDDLTSDDLRSYKARIADG